jgi:hypothetical protein
MLIVEVYTEREYKGKKGKRNRNKNGLRDAIWGHIVK